MNVDFKESSLALNSYLNRGGLCLAGVLLWSTAMLGGCVDKTPVTPPNPARNTDAAEKFVVSLKIEEGAKFDRVEGYANYSIANGACVPMDHSRALGGVRPVFIEKIDLEVVASEDNGVFTTKAPREPFVSENYYGLDECRWEISIVVFKIYHSGSFQTAILSRPEIKNFERKVAMCYRDIHRSGTSCPDPEYISPGIRNLVFLVAIQSHRNQ